MEPKVGRNPVAPQFVEGEIIEPSVSVPIAKGTRPATVAAVEPEEDQLDPNFVFPGCFVLPPFQ